VREIGFPPDWQRHPLHERSISTDQHWSKTDDFNHGDPKLIWEPNRLAIVYTLVRAYAANGDERYPAAFWALVEDWKHHNPPQLGFNWKCGQEASLRLMAWCFGLYAFSVSRHTTPERVVQLVTLIGAHAERIEANIDYARSQKNNHALSEATGMLTVGLLFPELKRSSRWLRLGREILEKEVRRQIYDDGAYAMSSTNYHRVMLHITLWAMGLANLNGQPLSDEVYHRFDLATHFLYQMINPETGEIPNYGANDGTLVLPLNSCDYNDFRPVLQAAHYLVHQERLFPPGPWDEDLIWLFGTEALETPLESSHLQDFKAEVGGYYLLRSPRSFVFTRCASYRDRPVQADMLHVDLWWRGQNVALDAGTYSYNAQEPWNDPFAHTAFHNTVTVDGRDQMVRVSKFLWLPWLQSKVRCFSSSAGGCITYWEGEHDGFRGQRIPVTHRRGILRLGEESWLITDVLNGYGSHLYRLHWLLTDVPYEWIEEEGCLMLECRKGTYYVQMSSLPVRGKFSLVRGQSDSPRGWRAPYYYYREPVLSAALSVQATNLCFLTFFGPQQCEMTTDDKVIRLETGNFQGTIYLQTDDKDPSPFISSVSLTGELKDQLVLS
jgi:asparagine synthase (glutamine-hydrolysing)